MFAFIITVTLYLKNNLREEIFWLLASELAVHEHWVLGVTEWNRLHHGSWFRSRFSSNIIRLTLRASFSPCQQTITHKGCASEIREFIIFCCENVPVTKWLIDPCVALEKASRENRAKQFAPVDIRPCRLNS